MQNINTKLWEPARVLREAEEPISYFVQTKKWTDLIKEFDPL